MESQKCVPRCVVVCVIAIMWLTGCANNETSAPISSVGDSRYSGNATTIKNIPQSGQVHTAFRGGGQHQVNISPQRNIVYNRNYNSVYKCSYSGATYQVKRGDTLFYIAWITGNNYRDLAQRNNIPKPYSLHIGQILQVGNRITSITSNVPVEIVIASNANQVNTNVVVAPLPTSNQQLIESRVNSNKNNGYPKSSSKQSVEKMLPTVGTTITTTVPVMVPSTVPAATKSDSISITGWCWPTNGKVINNFSTVKGNNKGVDISGSRGQSILATAKGRVVYAGNALQGYGNLIIIKHNDDYLSVYAHNDTMLVRKQQEVRAGQKIATMGNTGTSTTRLYFEIRYKGKSVNPLYYLPQR